MRTVNEEGTIYIDVTFYNTDNETFTPAAAQYRIDCLTTGNEVRSWTDLVPAESITIAVTGSDNQIFSEVNNREMRQIVVKYTDSFGREQISQSQYRVDNLQGIR